MSAYWGKKPSYQPPPEQIKPGDGVNTYGNAFELKKSECVSSLNTSNRLYPGLCVRPGMLKQFDTNETPLVNVSATGARDGSTFHVQEGAKWKYWKGLSLWVEKAPIFTTDAYIDSLAVFDGKIYGGVSGLGKLLEWNGTNAWAEKAPKYGAETELNAIAVFNGKLYGGTYPNCKLLEWNGTNAWVEKATQIGTETLIKSLCVFNNKLYAGTFPGGKLYEWNGTNAWAEKAPQFGAEINIGALCVFNNKLYGATYGTGKLLEWNGTNAWAEKAPQLGTETSIHGLAVFNGKLYGSTNPGGKLYEWNGTNAWVEKAPQLGTESSMGDIVVYNNKLYAGTYPSGKLYEWNGVNAWKERLSQLGTAVSVDCLVEFSNKLYAGTGDTGKLYQWDEAFTNVVASGLTNTRGNIFDFNTESKKYTILVNGTDKKSWDGTTVADMTAAPATKLYCAADNRLYALMGSLLKYSALGTIDDWTTLDDAGQEVLAEMMGTPTAIVSYNDMKIAFSDQTMHIMYGKNVFEYSIASPIKDGCVNDRGILTHGGILYFVDYYKIKAFSGGLPVDISQKVKAYMEGVNYQQKDKICAGKWGKYLYFSIPYGNSVVANTLTLEYDTELKTWYPWNIGFTDFINTNEELYGIDTAGIAWKLQQGTDDDGTAIVWEHTTGIWDANPVRQRKVISDIWAIIDLPTTSTMSIYYSSTADSNDFTLLKAFTGNANEQNTRVQVPTSILYSVPWYRLKFSGTGYAAIHFLEPVVRIKRR